MRRSRKKRDGGPKYHLNHQKFENAKWILKNDETGETIECDYWKMSNMVENGYVLYFNNKFTKGFYKEVPIKAENVVTRELNIAAGTVAETNKGVIIGIAYNEVLPNYTVIDCYDYKYQCKACDFVTDQIRGKGQEKEKESFCISCFKFSKFR